jgi:hypothetical protein
MTTEQTLRRLRVGVTVVFMAAAAFCVLKYLWWAACYSGWYGLPGYAQQLRDASIRANVYWWSVMVLEAPSVGVVWSLVQFRGADMSQLLRRLARFGAALGVTAIGTGIFLGVMIVIRRSAS